MNEQIKSESKKALWFSRHTPTAEQIAELRGMDYNLVITANASHIASINLNDDADVKACLTALFAELASTGAEAIIGVFATPISKQIFRTMNDIIHRGGTTTPHGGLGDYPCLASWSTARAEDGERPLFAHKSFERIGYLSQTSLRWL